GIGQRQVLSFLWRFLPDFNFKIFKSPKRIAVPKDTAIFLLIKSMPLFLFFFPFVVCAKNNSGNDDNHPANQRENNILPSKHKRLVIDAQALEKNQQVIKGNGGRQSEKCSDQFSFHGIVLLVLFDVGTSIAYPP
ncbi:MAG: hypothetical protein IIU42_05895, partial [Ruminococcus sp.]|nr:hypothetical protein [Ruminococcus sp.]